MPRATAPRFSLDDLHDLISSRFDETQNSLSNHKKNCVALYKIHAQASKLTKTNSRVGEEAFEAVFIDMLARTLAVKQGPCPDRVVKFVASYVKFVNDKGVCGPSLIH
jgi:condensin complex subunit 3